MKVSQVIASIIITASVLSHSLPANAATIIYVDPDTCILRGGQPLSPTVCRLN
jgi:hypothetical protein